MPKSNDQNRVVVKVFLYGIQPQIWRRFSISTDATFIALSNAIQAAMGWEDKHPHEFRHGKGKRLVDVIGPIGLQDQVLGAFQDTLLVGQGPRLAGVDPTRGSLRWEVAVATPRGTNEVERLADLLAPAVRVGNTVCARAFQNAVGCVNAERGTSVWTRNVGGNEGIGADAELVVGADGSDRVTAWRAATGEVAWTTDKLLYRDLSAPLLVGRTAVFGDAQGNVHLLAREDGKQLLRLTTDGSAVVAPPALSGKTMLVVTRAGGLFAFRPE